MTCPLPVWTVPGVETKTARVRGWCSGVALFAALCGCAEVSTGREVARPNSAQPRASVAIAPELVAAPSAATGPPRAARALATHTPSPPVPLKHYAADSAGPPTFPVLEFNGDTYGLLDSGRTPTTATLIDMGASKAAIFRDIHRDAWPEKILRLVNTDGSTCAATVEDAFIVVETAAIEKSDFEDWKKQGMSDEAIALEVFKFQTAMNALRVLPSAECHGNPVVVQSLNEPVPRFLDKVSMPGVEERAIEFARGLSTFAELDAQYREAVLDKPLQEGDAPPAPSWESQGGFSAHTFASAGQPRYVRITVDSGWACSGWRAWRAVLLLVDPKDPYGFRVVTGEVGEAMTLGHDVAFLADLEGSGTLMALFEDDSGFTLVDDRWHGSRNWYVVQPWACPC